MSGGFIFELMGADEALVAACTQALFDFGLVRVVGPEDTQMGRAPDATLVCIRIPVAVGIASFAQSRAFRPHVPVLLIGDAIDTDVATELIKCGADEFVTRSSLPQMLRPKLERALHLRRGTVLGRPEFGALGDSGLSTPTAANRRRCFRAKSAGAVLTVALRAGETRLTMDEFSIPTDGWPGGVGVLVDEATLRRLPIGEWSRAASIALAIHALGEVPIPISARLIGGRQRRVGLMTRLAFQYLPTVPTAEAALRRIWVAGQRKVQT